jgi:uncharacterized protein YdhG (YjbR/CyaY superfamily)
MPTTTRRMSTRAATAPDQPAQGFTDEERAALQERAGELQAAKRSPRRSGDADEEHAVLAKLAEMSAADRDLGERLHALIRASAPGLSPKLWYGMPAYARGGKVICFFQGAQKFKTRYATLGFSDQAQLDDGALWPTAFALTAWTTEVEATIGALIRRAVN